VILADTLKVLTTMGPRGLAQVLDASGYTMCSFESAEFVGITNGGEFCYSVTYYDDGGGPEETLEKGKVFVKYDRDQHYITADF
jgi:hypothetical protein